MVRALPFRESRVVYLFPDSISEVETHSAHPARVRGTTKDKRKKAEGKR